MPLDARTSLLIILITALCTFATRAFPFLLFPKGKAIPKAVLYLGKVLPAAVIGMLIIYCLQDVSLLAFPHGIPELIGILVTAGLYLWKRNNLLSIGAGTILYMVLVQTVF